ncbi:hypothetical protein HYZ78_04155 [Candidatus Microgenomates bacterium]|nr:hypothetical protein [Candidatus Microgenomates bacterium]
MGLKIWLASTTVIIIAALLAVNDTLQVVLTKKGYLTLEQQLAIVVLVIGWVLANYIFGVFFTKEEESA